MPRVNLFVFLTIALALSSVRGFTRHETVSQSALDAFQKWFWPLIKNDNPKINLCINEAQNDIGVCALKDIQANEEVLRIPYNLMITSERILEATELKEVLTNPAQFTDVETIAVYLTYLKFCEPEINPWVTWLALLPERYNSILYYKDDELKLLEGTTVYDSAVETRQNARTTFDKVVELFQKTGENFKCELPVTYDNWRWALSTVRSRKVSLLDSEGKPFATIVPYFDFFNHVADPDQKSSWGYNSENKFFHAEVPKTARAGREITQFYGPLPTSTLVLDYGIFIEENPFDFVLVDTSYLGVDPEEPIAEMKDRLLNFYRTEKAGELKLLTKNMITKELLTSAQIINAGEEDFENGKLKPKKSFLTDYYVALWFQAVSKEALDKYPTTAQDDEDLMRSSQFSAMNPKAQNAIRLRHAEKKIWEETLVFWFQYEKKMIEVMKNTASTKTEL